MGQEFLPHTFLGVAPPREEAMKDSVRRFLWILLAVFMALTFYGIFNAGNPRSLFRLVVRDPGYDVAVTVGLSVVVAILVVLLTAGREQTLRHLLDMNADYMRELRRKGHSDEQIAESFLAELKVRKGGLLYSLAKNRTLRYLSKLT
jgi:hypothetical protein